MRFLRGAALTRIELAVISLGIAALAAVAFLGHIRHGGFYADDWSVLSLVRFHGHGSVLQTLAHYYGRRPGQVLFLAALDGGLGYDAHLQLTLAAALLAIEVICLYALLREIGMVTLHAALISGLVLIFPFSDSLWLWSVETTATLAATLYLVGVLLALRAFEHRGWRSWTLHAASLALYLVALFTYEWFAVIGCLVGLLYVQRAGWRRARARWAVDVVAIIAVVGVEKLVLSDRVTPYKTQSLSGMAHHAGMIAGAGARIVGSAAIPFGSPDYRVILVALGVVALVAAGTRVLLPRGDPARAALARWLLAGGAGLLLAAAAWAIYIPGIDHYSPGALGTGNRVNGLAGIGVVILLYSAAMLLGTLLSRASGRVSSGARIQAVASVAAFGFSLFLGAGYLRRVSADSALWDRSAAAQRQLLASMHALVPKPPARATLYVFGFRPTGAEAPAFEYPWELSSAIKWSYGNAGLAGAVVDARTKWACDARGVSAATGIYAGVTRARYGEALFVDVSARRAIRVMTRSQCARPIGIKPQNLPLATAPKR
jgi:hypothetical protein